MLTLFYQSIMENCSSSDLDDFQSAFLPFMLILSFCPILLGSLYGVFSALFDKEVPVVPVNLTDQTFYGKNMKGLAGQRIKHRFVVIRHGESEHNVNFEKGSSDLKVDSPLTCVGHEQAKAIARYLDRIGFLPDNICISPMLRTRQTAEPTLQLFQKEISSGQMAMIVSPKYMEINAWKECKVGSDDAKFTSYKESFTEFVSRISSLFEHMRIWSKNLQKPTQTLVFTHSMVISELLNHIVNRERVNVYDDEWSEVYWQVANGSLTCVDYTENDEGREEWHIQTTNYCKHLPILSGVKSPFV